MENRKKSKIIFSSVLIVVLLIAAGWILMQGKKDKSDKVDEKTSATSSRIQVINGITNIVLSPSEQSESGITTIKLTQTLNQAQMIAYGYVVSIQDLSKDVQSFEAGKAQLAKSKESFSISQNNYERTKNLYDKKLASEQDFQSSQAAFLSDQADVNSASANLNSLRSSIVEQWGDKLSKWIFDGSPELQRLLNLDETLIQISLPNVEMSNQIPDEIIIQSPSESNKKITCRFVSAGHLANAQFQTKTLYYVVRGASLSSGMNVKAFLPSGGKLSGVVVPSESVLWYQGKAWVYGENLPNKFIRVQINTGNPSGSGFFIPQNKGTINPGVKIVKSGAQLLLSEELTPAQGRQTSEGDND